MSSKVKLGDTIHLNLQLEDKNPSLYPRAILRDQDGAELVSSPVDLTHTANGLYQNDDVVMPNTEEVTATYIIYEDVARTIESPFYGAELDVFGLDNTAFLVENINSNVLSILAGNVAADLTAVIQDNGLLFGEIIDNGALSAELQDEGQLLGIIEEDEIIGILSDGELIEAVVAC